jgi:hypothetical protein
MAGSTVVGRGLQIALETAKMERILVFGDISATLNDISATLWRVVLLRLRLLHRVRCNSLELI